MKNQKRNIPFTPMVLAKKAAWGKLAIIIMIFFSLFSCSKTKKVETSTKEDRLFKDAVITNRIINDAASRNVIGNTRGCMLEADEGRLCNLRITWANTGAYQEVIFYKEVEENRILSFDHVGLSSPNPKDIKMEDDHVFIVAWFRESNGSSTVIQPGRVSVEENEVTIVFQYNARESSPQMLTVILERK